MEITSAMAVLHNVELLPLIMKVSCKNSKLWLLIECQKLCDASDYCFAWIRGKNNGQKNKVCVFKQLDGWTPEQKSNWDSGFKNQWPFVEENARLKGGNYICDQQNSP